MDCSTVDHSVPEVLTTPLWAQDEERVRRAANADVSRISKTDYRAATRYASAVLSHSDEFDGPFGEDGSISYDAAHRIIAAMVRRTDLKLDRVDLSPKMIRFSDPDNVNRSIAFNAKPVDGYGTDSAPCIEVLAFYNVTSGPVRSMHPTASDASGSSAVRVAVSVYNTYF